MLEAKGVTIRYGGLTAVDHVDMVVRDHKITGLIGPNGAGKTTFFNCISGVYKPNEGSVIFDGKHIEGKKPYQICDAGISRTYQVINLFWNMTAIENVMVGMHPRLKSTFLTDLFKTPAVRAEERAAREKAYEWLKFVGLEKYANEPAGALPYGGQRLLEIVRGLASDAKILLLDEPVAGMNTKEKAEFDGLLQEILKKGVTILMVEHDMELVMGICDYLYVLEYGKLLAEGVPDEIQKHPEVIRAYLGGE